MTTQHAKSNAREGDGVAALIAKWRREADDCELAALEADSIGLDKSAIVTDAHAKNLRACADELEAALANPPGDQRQEGECDCPGEGKADPMMHAPNCPARKALAP